MNMRDSAILAATLAIVLAVGAGTPGAASRRQATGSVANPPQATPLPAKPNDPVALLSWRSVGPPRGGRSIAVSGVKGRPKDAYFGAVGGGLWKTSDGGDNWMPVTDGQIKSSSVGA